MSTRKLDTKVIVEIAVTAALAFVLSFVRLYRMPQGGSITLEMVPIFYLAFRSGVVPACWAGGLLGLLNLFGDAYIIHPVQLIMDYPLPFAMLGLAGLLPNRPILGVIVGSAGRLLIHTLAGVIFWASYAPEGQNVWIYSIGYNATYLVPQMVLSAIVIVVLTRTSVWPRERRQFGQ